ncbi:MAG: hypothetical protein H7Z43_10910 [Clostridia bacterium]|nr:hypothetical protein [Deltaproteobacteria bacterium]
MHRSLVSRPANHFARSRDPVATTAIVPSHKRYRAASPKPRSNSSRSEKIIIPPLPDLSIFAKLGKLIGPYGASGTQLAVGAWFAISQLSHIVQTVNPGAAQLVRSGGGGVLWHILAAIAGGAAAIHGAIRIVKLYNKRKKA